jgi:hypothetical protein
MPVTELAFFPTTSGTVSPALLEATAKAFQIQDEWCASNLPSPPSVVPMAGGLEARGVAYFQQVEDPSVTMLTAHWDSVAQHMAWIGTEANKSLFPLLDGHLAWDKMRFFHIDGVSVFQREVMESEIVTIARYGVGGLEKKAAVTKALEELRPFGAYGGWRIEKDEGRQDWDEFVVVHGRARDAAGDKQLEELQEMLRKMSQDCVVETYRRVL